MTTRAKRIELAEKAVIRAALRFHATAHTPYKEGKVANAEDAIDDACIRLLKARSVKLPSGTHRHKWSKWEYGGAFEDGYTRICAKCQKVQVK